VIVNDIATADAPLPVLDFCVIALGDNSLGPGLCSLERDRERVSNTKHIFIHIYTYAMHHEFLLSRPKR